MGREKQGEKAQLSAWEEKRHQGIRRKKGKFGGCVQQIRAGSGKRGKGDTRGALLVWLEGSVLESEGRKRGRVDGHAQEADAKIFPDISEPKKVLAAPVGWGLQSHGKEGEKRNPSGGIKGIGGGGG